MMNYKRLIIEISTRNSLDLIEIIHVIFVCCSFFFIKGDKYSFLYSNSSSSSWAIKYKIEFILLKSSIFIIETKNYIYINKIFFKIMTKRSN